MKNLILFPFLLSLTLFASCENSAEQNNNEQETVYFNEEAYLNNQQQNSNFSNQNNPNMQSSNFNNQNNQQTNVSWSNQNNTSTNGGGIKNISVPDIKTGQTQFYMPVPTSWNATPNGLTGPNGLRASELPEMCYQSKMGEAIVSSREVLQKVTQELKQGGFSITRTYDIPSIAQCRKQINNQRWKSAPMTYNSTAVGIEGTSPQREKVLLILIHNTIQSQYYQSWAMDTQIMTSNDNYYAEGKKAVIYALSNMKYDQQYIAQWNQQQQAKTQNSNSSFQKRMANNRRNFEITNKAIVGAHNDVNTMSMNGYYSRSNSQDRLQQSQVQGVWNRSIVQNPSTGQNWEVEGQAQQYWMDGQGNYLPSNDLNWNPNTDPNYNGTQWTQTQNINGGN